ncbi:N-6 DNA methylase [Streptomyces flavidovirens]|uniref:N-6 DNA methylase n=1 Tax=Streptomyces flavidovirens TaxID=67298 RepID=UPI001FCC320B|nr:N-6 DNA methylase [Streptomyces flavidovirens]
MADVVVTPGERERGQGQLTYRRVLGALDRLRRASDADTAYRLAFQVVYLQCKFGAGAGGVRGTDKRWWSDATPRPKSVGEALSAVWSRTHVAREYRLPAYRDEGVSRPFAQTDAALEELVTEVGRLETAEYLLDVLLDLYSTRYARGGDYFTPDTVAYLFAGLAAPRAGEMVRDPACGSGRLLRAAAFRAQAQGAELHLSGADIRPLARYAAAVNLALHGFRADLAGDGTDTLRAGLPQERTDVIITNPTVNMRDWGHGELQSDARWDLGVPRPGNANFAWIQHVLADLAPHGRAVILLSSAAAHSSSSSDGLIRQRLLENGLVAGIVDLPSWPLAHTRTSTALWLLAKGARPNGDRVLFADAGELPTWRDGARRGFDTAQAERLFRMFRAWQGEQSPVGEDAPDSVPWCRAASLEEIARAGFDLRPARYLQQRNNVTSNSGTDSRIRKRQLYEAMDRSAAARHRVRGVLEGRHE